MYKSDLIRKYHSQGISLDEIVVLAGTTRDYAMHVISALKRGEGENKRFRLDQFRYRKKHPDKRNAQRKRNYEKGAQNARRSGSTWLKGDKKLILSFAGTDRHLAEKIGRSVTAVQQQRWRIKKKPKK